MSIHRKALVEQKQDRKREEIIRAAQEVVRLHGIEQLSLRLIADQMGVTAASLYRYFESKEAILAALMAESRERMWEVMGQVPSDLPPTDRLVAFGLSYLEFARAHPVLFKFAFMDTPSERPGLNTDAFPNSPYRLLLDAAQSAADAGILRPKISETVETVAYTVWSLAHGMAVLEATHLKNFAADFATAHQVALRALVDGMTAPK